GFEAHENLSRMTIARLCKPRFEVLTYSWGEVCTVDAPSDHGNHVAGIVAADSAAVAGTGQGRGTTGVDPYSNVTAINRNGIEGNLWTALSMLLDALQSGKF